MTGLLELREKLRNFYGRYETYVIVGTKFVLGVVLFGIINGRIGYMSQANHPALVLMLALVCAFLPINVMMMFACVLILLHLFSLALEVCVIALCLFLLMFFMYVKYAPQNGYSAILSFLLCFFRIPQVMPVAVGLLKGPSSYLSVLCGTATFFYIRDVQENFANFTSTDDEEVFSRLTAALKMLTGDKEMYLVLAAFFVTSITVYLIRRQSANYAWRIALAIGNVMEMVILLVGYILLELSDNILWVILGTAISMIICLILEFFFYNLDYSRIERVQFEDDEYYYFVKAVPKVYLAQKEKRVKQITPKNRTIVNRKELAEELDIDRNLLRTKTRR